MLTDKYHSIEISLIDILPDRQRKVVNTDDLESSIAAYGVIQPIVVEPNGTRYELIAGERRLTACKKLGLIRIPARFSQELTPVEKKLIELEENVKRKDLPWQDEVNAVQEIHKLLCSVDPTWTQDETANSVGLSRESLTKYLAVAEALPTNKMVQACTGIVSAYNIVSRINTRNIDDAMNEFLSTPKAEPIRVSSTGTHTGSPQPQAPLEEPQLDDIREENFHDFAKHYSGVPFNFLHCDFPYGINHQNSEQGRSEQFGGYEDTEETYWSLIDSLLNNQDRLLAPSAHILFWLSSDITIIFNTIDHFRADQYRVCHVPLVWLKTDNRGIMPDATREPRRIYETALLISRGDRKIIRATSNAYPSPTTKEIHQSEKPEPMLRYFFQMFVDNNTRMLDPTCGSGTSVRAADSLGAQSVLGLEINPEHVKAANIALRKSRLLRTATKELAI